MSVGCVAGPTDSREPAQPASTIHDMNQTLQFRVADHGAVLSTRSQGRAMLEHVPAGLGAGAELVIDFAGVHASANSFMDEFLGGLLERGLDERTLHLTGVEPQVARVAQAVLARRGAEEIAERIVAPAA
jgi:hypothetical protein